MLRKKEERFVVVFDTTASAMAMEKQAKLAGSIGRLIPTPPSIRGGCGFAWSSPVAEEVWIRQMILDKKIITANEKVIML